MGDLLKRIPTKILIILTLATFLFAATLIAYSVIYQNAPVEIFGIVKFGERADDLRARLLKAQAEAESRISPEVYKALLGKLKAAESRNYSPKIEAEKFEAKIKERDDTISDLRRQLVETKTALENAKSDLQRSAKASQELKSQLIELKQKVEDISLADKRKGILGFVHQLNELEKNVGGSKDAYAAQAHARSYNQILTGIKRELPNDAYLQSANPVSDLGTLDSITSGVKDSFSRLRVYLEQRYLK